MRLLCQCLAAFGLVASLGASGWAQSVPVRGQVEDPTGGALAGVTVVFSQNNQKVAEARANLQGEFSVSVPPGEYQMEVAAASFAPHTETIEVRAGMGPLQVVLHLAPLTQSLDVQEAIETVSPDPDRNLSATVLTAEDLLDLPEDEDDLTQIIQELAGDGPEGEAEMIVDGFAGGQLPPRDQIQEIRINQNPFTSEFSRPGHSRVEVITRAGTGELHGNLSFNFRDGALNARQALADSKPPYQQRTFRANLGGPIIRNRLTGSLFVRRSDEAESDSIQALTPEGLISSAVVHPTSRWEVNGRVQYKLAERHTLDFSAERQGRERNNQGVGETTLPERAFDVNTSRSYLRVRETAVLSSSTLNEARFQVEWNGSNTVPLTEAPAINVLDAFRSGGAQNRSREDQHEFEFGDTLTFTHGIGTFRSGVQGWYRSYNTLAQENFLGTYVFSSLAAYQNGLPTTFTRQQGDPALDLNQLEMAGFFQSDWKLRRDLTLSLGLRYEAQSNISDRNNFDPRIGVAYALDRSTAIRGGVGFFHQRLGAGTVLSLRRLDGTRQSELVIRNPAYPDPFAGDAGGELALPDSVRSEAKDLALPYSAEASLSIERRLPRGISLSATYETSRGIHLYRSRNLNAPLPGTLLRPDPLLGNIDLLESTALSRYHSLQLRYQQRVGPTVLVVNYTLSRQRDDTDGAFSLPANNYDLRSEWGRAGRDQLHSLRTFLTLTLPWGLRTNARLQAGSGRPYDITTGYDDNGDTDVNDRPLGVARNSGGGPGLFNLSMNFSKTISLKKRSQAAPQRRGGGGGGRGGGGDGGGGGRGQGVPGFQQGGGGPGFGGGGLGGGRGGPRGSSGGPELTLFVDVRNILNHTNFTRYSGVLSSPFFGEPVSARSPREIGLGVRFNF